MVPGAQADPGPAQDQTKRMDGLDFETMIERNNRGEIRVLLLALVGLALLVVASVGIAVNDVANAGEPRRDDAAVLSGGPENAAPPTGFD